MATFPTQLPSLLLANYQEVSQPNVIRSSVAAGPSFQRRRFTKRKEFITGSFLFDRYELEIFEVFFHETLNGGALEFDWVHPKSGEDVTARFVADEGYTKEARSNDNFRVGVEIEITSNPLIAEVSIANATASEDNGTITFVVTRSTKTGVPCSVKASTSSGTATAGQDFEDKTETIKFEKGQTTKNFVVTLLDDSTFEGNETFTVTLSEPLACKITGATATGTITEDDSAPTVSVDQNSYTVDEDTGTMQVQVNLTGAHDVPCSVDWELNDGTAIAATDYTDDTNTLTWAAGDTAPKTVDITIIDRGTAYQGDRDFTFDLSNPTDCTVGTAQATITIQDQEVPLVSNGALTADATLTRNSTATYWDVP